MLSVACSSVGERGGPSQPGRASSLRSDWAEAGRGGALPLSSSSSSSPSLSENVDQLVSRAANRTVRVSTSTRLKLWIYAFFEPAVDSLRMESLWRGT
ncbi:hypothetical protein OJAV_G00216250 [Oryzias javanicus]|uniref:Uncharacterized protein n=1 Tax=Oryzias javanicus TaxID=123683 RepID=A0A3S2M076_ORYJA|nr:hypothetical protein OJAV_G00216250 [Oryzias javanicus]